MRSSPGTDQGAQRGPVQHDPVQRDQAERPVEEPSAELEQLRGRLAETEDRYLRARADLDNYRKRAERDLERLVQDQADAMLRSWLEIADSVERALEHDDGAGDGLRVVFDQMQSLLARYGIARTGEVGEPFDPQRHEAVSVDERPGGRAGTVTGVARSGYAAGDRVVRPAQVAVARPPDDGD
jgi:molecular chaperone GrpE